MPILPLNIENFNGKKLMFLLTLKEYREPDYIAFYMDESDNLFFQGTDGMLPFEELPVLATIALYECLPFEVKNTPEYLHVPMRFIVEDYLKVVFGKKINQRG
ncbi:hypothetical protein [Robertkochia solimangrovi]|uniref:hypothetical protein n=1 Tax=Robertkochia solimangrovi TaxID=2213046 RepID=UPI00117FC13D|nr:hypothetical protein [Robertkochia solimangrovi]TRZ45226.1 hypothetical protein DMZ48_05615 [Robertkochia solimangrovi]